MAAAVRDSPGTLCISSYRSERGWLPFRDRSTRPRAVGSAGSVTPRLPTGMCKSGLSANTAGLNSCGRNWHAWASSRPSARALEAPGAGLVASGRETSIVAEQADGQPSRPRLKPRPRSRVGRGWPRRSQIGCLTPDSSRAKGHSEYHPQFLMSHSWAFQVGLKPAFTIRLLVNEEVIA